LPCDRVTLCWSYPAGGHEGARARSPASRRRVLAVLREALIGSAAYLVYWLTAVAVLLCARRLFGLGGELFRKLLHIIVASSVFVLLNVFDTWWLAALAPVGFGAAVYLVIGWAERIPRVMRILEERKPGE